MPLTATYTWVESESTVQLQVPLKGQPISKVDVFGEKGRYPLPLLHDWL